MPQPTYGDHKNRWEFQGQALAANAAELPQLEMSRVRLTELNVLAKDLTAEQASLTARKQEVSKKLAEVIQEGKKLSAFLDAGVRLHYGNRAEKLVEFGLKPFRSRPRGQVLVGPDGKPFKPPAIKEESPAQPPTP